MNKKKQKNFLSPPGRWRAHPSSAIVIASATAGIASPPPPSPPPVSPGSIVIASPCVAIQLSRVALSVQSPSRKNRHCEPSRSPHPTIAATRTHQFHRHSEPSRGPHPTIAATRPASSIVIACPREAPTPPQRRRRPNPAVPSSSRALAWRSIFLPKPGQPPKTLNIITIP